MSPEAQRIAIAEACGWTPIPEQRLGKVVLRKIWESPAKDDHAHWPEDLPDYLNDLNAMREAEKVLSHVQNAKYDSESLKYVGQLVNVTGGFEVPDVMFRAAHATAAHRAEAFLRTIGKWEP